jgi:hypothetical protein
MANQFVIKNGLKVQSGGINVTGSLTLSDDLVVQGSITAETYIVSSSVTHMTTSFSSGSTIFGDDSGDTHEFTGSVSISSTLNLDSVVNASTDTNKFLVLDSNDNVDFRTGAELRSDIDLGATDVPTFSGAAFSGLTNANTDTDKFLVLNSSNIVKFRTGAEIASDIGALTSDPTLQEVTDAGATTTNEISTPSLSVGASGTSISSSLGGATLLIGDLTNSDSTVDIRAFGDGTNAGGRLVISDDFLDFTSAGTSYLQVDSDNVTLGSTLKLDTIVNAGTDTDKFLVLDSNGKVDFRTGDNLRADVGLTYIQRVHQTYVDFKNCTDGFLPWAHVTDIQPNSNKGFAVWISPDVGGIEKIIISPEQTNTTTANMDVEIFVNGTKIGSTQTVAMGAAGTNKTFTFSPLSTYDWSAGDRVSVRLDKNTNTADFYAVSVLFSMTNDNP